MDAYILSLSNAKKEHDSRASCFGAAIYCGIPSLAPSTRTLPMAPTGLYHQVSKYFKNTSMYQYLDISSALLSLGTLITHNFSRRRCPTPLVNCLCCITLSKLVILFISVLASRCMTFSYLLFNMGKSFLALIEPWTSRAATALLALFFGISSDPLGRISHPLCSPILSISHHSAISNSVS